MCFNNSKTKECRMSSGIYGSECEHMCELVHKGQYKVCERGNMSERG